MDSPPKSLVRLVNFFRLFGYQFGHLSTDQQPSSVKKIIGIAYNVFAMMFILLKFTLVYNNNQMKYFKFRVIILILIYITNHAFIIFPLVTYGTTLFGGHRLFVLLNKLSWIESQSKVDDRLTMKLVNLMIALIIFGVVILSTFTTTVRFLMFDKDFLSCVSGLLVIFFNIQEVVSVSFLPTIYVYATVKIAQRIQQLSHSSRDLENTYDQLMVILKQLRQIQHLLATPILISMLCILIITLSSCCLIISPPKIFLLLANILGIVAALSQLFIFCFFGTRIPTAFDSLLAKIRRQSDVPNCYIQAFNSLRKQFDWRVYDMFALNWSTVLAIAAFVLQYTVILIQTDKQTK